MTVAASMRTLNAQWEYDPDDVLGEGGQARTYAGRNRLTGEPVAVKLLDAGAPVDVRQRFAEEVALHRSLDHPAIVPLLDAGPDDDPRYIVMPRLARSLGAELTSRDCEPLTPAHTLRIGERIAEALAYLHGRPGRPAVHGDVSPGNILLDDEGRAYLCDFGVSKLWVSGLLASSRDRWGTAGFASPRKQGKRTYADDVYSLAAVLWFCLTGEVYAARREPLPPPALRAPLMRALRWHEPTMPRAGELLADLRRGWSKRALDWRHDSEPRRPSRLPLIAIAGTIGLLLAAFAGRALPARDGGDTQTTLHAAQLAFELPGGWTRRPTARIAGVPLRSALAAGNASALVTAGLTTSAGASLIGPAARRALPVGARRPRRVVVAGMPALRFGPDNTTLARAVELLAFALERDVLVLECRGPATAVRRICSRASAGLELEDGRVQPLATSRDVAARLGTATRALNDQLGVQRARQRAVLRPAAARAAAAASGRAYERYARALVALPTTARTAPAIDGTARSARAAAAAYRALAASSSDAGWRAARRDAVSRERELARRYRALGALGYRIGR